mmetsp:Transcript_23204/g.38413  ORF Transcript_23204/g.38413 Transcript_23204/m.38413 type:complete len:445 (+) Transcript_23204:47-1381(+)|eukprot:CAMPEP_0119006268 /NCGR_PEP_ID=MMETSP1176-20130426/2202_1 /TAXON_ID=265551 /ORGANISM="Synedropsis recta cf, Strain CCMP1620" /LENGTH=444 /DNA_ID=CAMNT_0006958167 /DNA_START=45 /DNA_END=1379 /DNA_ORIENTATION=+
MALEPSSSTSLYSAPASKRPKLEVSNEQQQEEETNMSNRLLSLTDFPEELLLHIFDYCGNDAPTLCALDVSCSLFYKRLTKSFWTTLAVDQYGSGKGAKRSYLAGRALTTRPPVQFRLESNPSLQGDRRYTSCLAASSSLIIMGVRPHAETTERLANFPVQVLYASSLRPVSCWPILHEPCWRVALVEDVVVLQTSQTDIWACHGCTKVKILLPSEQGVIRGIAGSKHGLAIVQESKLCLYKPSTHAALVLYQTIELDDNFSNRTCALSWSTCHDYLAYAGALNAKVWKWNQQSADEPLESIIDFAHNIRLYYGGNIAVSEKHVVISTVLSESDELKVFQLPSGSYAHRISTSKDAEKWSRRAYNDELHLCIVTHFLIVTSARGIGLMVYDLRTATLVRMLHSTEDSELHDMVRLPSMTSLSFMVTFSGGDQMVWGFEGCQELL